MSLGKNFWDLFVKRFLKENKPGKSPHSRKRSLQIETLEAKEMLSAIGIFSSPDFVEEGQSDVIRLQRDETQGDLTAFFELDYRNTGCYYGYYDDWAAQGQDFDWLPGTNGWYYQGHVTFLDGEAFVDIKINAKADQFLEGDEQIALKLIAANNFWGDWSGVSSNTTYTIDQDRSNTSLTIRDTTTPVTVWVNSAQNGTEGGTNPVIQLERDNIEKELTVHYMLDGKNSGYYYYTNQNPAGWARNGTDFAWLPGTDQYDYQSTGQVTFAAGERFAEITFHLIDDDWLEGTEEVGLTLLQRDDSYSCGNYNAVSYYLDEDRSSANIFIYDDEPAATVWIERTQNASEGGTEGFFELKRDNVDRALTVFYKLNDRNSGCNYCYYNELTGWAKNGEDFEYLPGTEDYWSSYGYGSVTFGIGIDTVSIPIVVKEDLKAEGVENVQITLTQRGPHDGGTDIRYNLDANRSTATISIADNEPTILVWIAGVQNASENDSHGYFQLQRSTSVGRMYAFFQFDANNMGTVPEGWAKAGTDFSWPGWPCSVNSSTGFGSVYFEDGQMTVNIPIQFVNDNWIEGPEEVRISLLNTNNDGRGEVFQVDPGMAAASLSILDDEVPVTVRIEKIQDGAEGVSNGIFRIHRDVTGHSLQVWFELNALNSYNNVNTLGWATNGVDFNYLPNTGYNSNRGSVTFGANDAYVDITVTVTNDGRMEGPEQVELTLSENTSGRTYFIDETQKTASLEIADDEAVIRVWFAEVQDGIEGVQDGHAILERDDPTSELTVWFRFDNNRGSLNNFGWARNGIDFALLPNTNTNSYRGYVTFAAGSRFAEIPILVTDDNWVEGTEQIRITLVQENEYCYYCYYGDQGVKYLLDPATSTATVQIHDNETPMTVWIEDTGDAEEDSHDGFITLKRSHKEGTLTVWFKLGDRNYGYCYYSDTNGWASNGNDFEFLPGTGYGNNRGYVTFEDGQDTLTIPVTVKDDLYIEGDEKIGFTLIHSNDNEPIYLFDDEKRETTITIVDDEQTVNIWVGEIQHAKEGERDGYFRVYRDNAYREMEVTFQLYGTNGAYGTYNYKGYAKNGVDFEMLPGTTAQSHYGDFGKITFEEGEYYVDIPVTLIEDDLYEGTETVKITLINENGSCGYCYYSHGVSYFVDPARAEGTLTIEDDELPTNIWIEETQNAVEGLQDGYVRVWRDNTQYALTVQYRIDYRNIGNDPEQYCYYYYGYSYTLGWAKNGEDFELLPGSTYQRDNGYITFEAGVRYVDIPITLFDDDKVEGNEVLTITLIDPQLGTSASTPFFLDASRKTATVEIVDNDGAVVWLENGPDSLTEGEEGYILLRRDNTANELTVRYGIEKKSTTATKGEDFEMPMGFGDNSYTGRVTFAIGQDTIRIPIVTIDDDRIENVEDLVLRIYDAPDPNEDSYYCYYWGYNNFEPLEPNYEVAEGRGSVRISIHDNDIRPTVWVDSTRDGTEGLEDGYVRIRRDDASNPLRISYRLNDSSTAELGTDFEYPSGMSEYYNETGFITFGAGVYYVDIPIRVIDDLDLEETKTISITIIPGEESVGGVNTVYDIDETRSTAVLSIYDNDTKARVWIESIQNAAEGGQDGYVRFQRDLTRTALTVYYVIDVGSGTAVMGEDFQQLTGMKEGSYYGSVTFAAGQEYVYIPINVINDTLIENTESLRIILTTGPGTYDLGENFEAIVQIEDNDVKTTVRIDSIQHGHEGVQDGYVRLYRDQVGKPLTVYFEYDTNSSSAVLGEDFKRFDTMPYGSNTASVTFDIGQHYVDIPLAVIDDTVVENTENLLIRLHQGVEGDASSYVIAGAMTAMVEIADNDKAASLWIDSVQDAYEGETGHVRIYRSNTAGTLRVGFRFDSTTATAVFGDDFNFGGVYDPATGIGYVDFADGQEYVDLAVHALRDLLLEDDETVPVTLLDSVDGQYVLTGASTAVVTIFDTGEEEAVPDAWRVGVFATDRYASEDGPNTAEFTVIRAGHNNVNQPLTVHYRLSGMATPGVDYTGIDVTFDEATGTWLGSFTFQAGQTHHILTLTPIADDIAENWENVIIELMPTTELDDQGEPVYSITSPSAVVIINEGTKVVDPGVDAPVKVTWDVNVSATDPHASEDGTNPGEFTIVRSGLTDVSQPLTVGFRITGSAMLNLDYTGIDATWDEATNSWVGTITFAANQTHYVLNVTPLADELVEGTENIVLTLLPTEATTEEGELLYALGSGTSATVNIKDATQIADPLTDPPIRETWDVSVIATDAYASEVRQNSGEFTIVRSGLTDLSKPLTVYFEITGTAAHNVDYTGLNVTTDPVTGKLVGSVTFQAGQKYVVLNVTPLLDDLAEGTENVVLTILSTDAVTENGQPVYAVDGTASAATVQIEDDTTVEAGTPWVSGDPEIREGRTYTLDLHDNEAGVIRWEINWGDGSAVQTFDGSVTQVTHFYDDGDENYTIGIVAITEETVQGGGEPAGGWQGLSHGYWKNHPQDWVFFNTTDNYEAIFGVSNSQKPGTLMQAIKTGGGQIKALWRESVAALQNATHPNIAYKFSVDEIISMVQAAYASGEYNYYKDILETENTRHNVDINTPGSGGGTGTTTREVRTELEKDVFVKNVAPDLTISGESKTLPNTAYVLHLSEYDPGDDTITRWTINWGDGVITVVQGNPSEVTHIYTAVGDYTITATATDEDGTWNANTVDVRVYEPQTGLLKGTPWISGDPEILEGRTYTLDLHANEAEILRWEITWGDGQTSVVDGAATKAEHFYADGDENFTITVTAVKQIESGTENVTMEQALLVLNVAPVLVISGSSKSDVYKDYVLNLRSSDPGDDTIQYWTINWGDGFIEQIQGNPSSATHSYTSEGLFTITATATDEDGTWNANSVDVAVNVPATGIVKGTPYITGDPSLDEGRTYTLHLHANEATILRWEITWGDGTSQIVDGSADYATHLYADGDEYPTISVVAVKDVNGETEDISLTKSIVVHNVMPTLIISGPTKAQPGSIYRLGLSSSDPGQDTITHWTIHWGDGIIETVEGDPSLATHIYASAGTYVISALATDEDGTWYSNLQHVTVSMDTVETEWIRLVEDDRFVTDFRTTFTVSGENKALVLETRNLQFDGGSEGMINDAFEVALVDANGTPLVATIRTTRDGFLNITEGMDSLLAAGVLYDSGSGRIILDLSRIATGTEATLIVRLVNNDSDTKTSVELNPNLGFIDSPFGTGNNMTPQENAGHRQQVDFTHLTDVTSMIGFGYETTTFNDQKGILRAGLTLTNNGNQSLRGPILVGIRNITDPSVSVTGYDGMTPDGMYYFDVSHFAFSGQDGTFDPDEIIRGLDLQFLNPDHVQFNYEIVVLAHINQAPTFISTPKTEVTAGNAFTYDSKATDPENDTLRYEKVFGPEGMIVDAKTGAITWTTTSDDVGLHHVVIRAYDTGGLYDEQNFKINVTEWVNRPPYFTSSPETEAFVGTVYHYQATADDPDGDDLTYSLVEAFVTGTNRPLTEFHATHHLTVSEDGMVTWNPPTELIGRTITVILEVSDGKGGTALQQYEIGIHSNQRNNPPVIITEPTTTITLPIADDSNSTGAVEPGALNLTLEVGEKTTQTVTVSVENQQLLEADIVFIIDESGSMGGQHAWLKGMIEEFDKKCQELGMGTRFALVGFGGGSNTLGHLFTMTNGTYWGNSAELALACNSLRVDGGFEDGYSAIDYAMNNLVFRDGAAKHFILITDEDRDNGAALNKQMMIDTLMDNSVTLHTIVNAQYYDQNGTAVLGGDADGNAFISAANGQYTNTEGLRVESGSGGTISHYVNFSFDIDINGTSWNLNQLRQGGNIAKSFTSAFIDTIAIAVLSEFEIDVRSSDPNIQFVNLTGVQKIQEGKLIFEVEITGDGNAHQFNLEFINVKNNDVLIGTIPCTISTGYVYDVDAIDADGDELIYSIVGETHGATINPHTGVLVWDPSEAGEYTFTVRVVDGRGGEDTQTWTVNVVNPAADNRDPTLENVENRALEVGASYQIPMVGDDVDGDSLRYFLVMNPMEGLTYPDNLSIDRTTGIIHWAPTADQIGTYTIRVQVSDGRGGSATTEFVIDVVLPSSMINNPPKIESDPVLTGTAEKTYFYQVRATDADGHALTYSLLHAPEGMIIDQDSGMIVWTPKYYQVGEFNVAVHVTDGQRGHDVQEFTLKIFSENGIPEILSEPSGPIVLNQAWQYQVIAVDPDGDPLVYAIDQASASRGMSVDANGLISWTPTETGIFDVLILVDDGRGGQVIQAFSIEIMPMAASEITSTPTGPAFLDEEWTYTVTTDQEPGTYTLALDDVSEARGMFFDGNTLRWTPETAGDAEVKITLTDKYGGTYTQTFAITAKVRPVASYPPSIDSEPAGPIYVGEEWTYQVIATDPGNYNVTIYLMEEDNFPVKLVDGTLRWTPEDTTPIRFVIRAENEHGAWSEQTFTINPVVRPAANDAPVVTSVPLGPTMVGEHYTYQVSAYDPDGDSLTFAVDEDSFNAGVRIDSDTGLLTWTSETAGTREITVIVTDSFGNARTHTFDLDVNPRSVVSEPPVITSKPTGPAYVGEVWSYTIEAYDPDNDALELWIVDENGEKLVQINPETNTITRQPAQVGSETIIIRAIDQHGYWTQQKFVLEAVEVPTETDAPRITSVPTGPAYIDEGYEYQLTAQVFDGSQPVFTVDPASLDRGIEIDAQGKLSWIPGEEGTFTIVVTVTDGSGKSSFQTITLDAIRRAVETVPPTITSKPTGPAYIDEAWSYQLTATADDGGAAGFFLIDENGDVVREIENGLLTETWDAEGTQKLIVRAVDSQGASIEQHITIQVVQRVVQTNDPPVVYSIPLEETRLGTAYKYTVLAFDPNGDSLTYSLTRAPDGASISPDGVLTWNPGTLGSFAFIVLVSDGVNEPVEHRFTVLVNPPVTINTPPQITSVPITTALKDQQYVYQPAVIDLDGDVISWFIDGMAIPEELRHEISFDGTTGRFTWTPSVAGIFSFTITAFDGSDYAEQLVTLSVNAPPVITDLPDPHVHYGQDYTSQVIAHDPDGDQISFRLENNPDPQGLSIGADGTLTWTNPEKLGRHTVTIVVSDGITEVRQQIQLTVIDASVPNEGPTLRGTLPGSIPVNVSFTYQLGAQDPENDPVTFGLVEGPKGMTISSNGRVEWTPTETGEVSFKVSLFDGQNTVVYTCTLSVVAQRVNNPPAFTSTSSTSATVNKQYVYKPTATDPDGDSVTITLVGGPSDLKMNAQGEIVWIPGSAWAGQKVSYTLRATDAYGASIDHVVELNVRSVILAPTLVMEALPIGKIGQVWTYQIKATDPQGEKVTFELVDGSYPEGMTINEQTGVVTYRPTELPDNEYFVIWFKVRAINESGVASANGVFPLQIDPNSAYDPGDPGDPGTPTYNNPPNLTLPESSYIEAGKPYTHQIVATDADNDTLTYTLTECPSGMSIDSSGMITWAPGTQLVGQVFKVAVKVSDGQTSMSGYYYLGITEPNKVPKIKAINTQTVTAGGQFRYYASATDENATDVLTYSLDTASLALGMTINAQTGLVTWNPGTERAGESHFVTVFVTDGRSEPQQTGFTMNVVEDTIAPTVSIVATPSKTAAGEQVTIYVAATDNIGVTSVTLQLQSIKDVNGKVTTVNKTITLENGRAVYTLAANEFGTLTFVAVAQDANGNKGRASTTVQAIDPTDTESPTVAITSHGQGSKIYGPVDIVGTVKDNEPGVTWTLKAIAMDNGKEVLIAEGNGNIENGVLGQFDTTMLRNGTWQIVLEAVDVGGNKSERYFNVELEGEYKLGNFNMSFTDFDIMLSGLGITITRTYDTLNADVMGDFGYGWTLDIATTEISVVIGDGAGAQNGFSPYMGISDGTHITITLPDGTKEGFTFQAVGGGYGSSSMYAGMIPSQYYKPSWIPDPGTKSTLQADDTWLYPWGDGTYYQMDSWDLNQSDYSPANVNGGFLTLTLRNGIDLLIDATNGKLYQAIDQSGNTLTFTDNSISHSSGKGVVFQRDYQGRITAITGPDGGTVTYEYDALGNLVASTDQSGATTRFTYLTGVNDPEHYLDEVIDPLGRPAAKTEFDDSGRVVKVTDADGKTIEYEWDVTGQVQKVTDQLNNTTIIHNDNRGNVVKEISPEGAVTLRTYDGNGNMLTETQVVTNNGQEVHLTTSYTYDADGNKLTETDARGNVTTYRYNQYGQLLSTSTNGVSSTTNYDSQTGLPTSTTDVNGNTTRYTFDSRGNMTTIVNSSGVQLISSEYNKYGEVTAISANGRTTYMEYDNNGDCIATWYTEKGVTVLDKTFYDDMRRVVGRQRVVDGVVLWTTSTEYNAAGKVIREVGQNGLETLYTYDVRGLQTEVRSQMQGTDGEIAWSVQRTVYDAAGRATYSSSYVVGTDDSLINGSHTEYDGDGRSILREQLLGLVIEIGEHGQSFVVSEGSVLASSSTTYNNAGWIVSSIDSNGLETRYSYNVFGETTQTQRELEDGRWMVSQRVYDEQGRIIFSTDSHIAGTSDPIYGTATEYDSKGRTESTTRYVGCFVTLDSEDNSSVVSYGTVLYQTSTKYDSKGRVQSSTDAYGNVTTYEYDNLDRQIAVNQSRGLRSETAYNSAGQVEKTISNIKINSEGTYDYSEAIITVNTYNMYGQVIKTVTDGRIVEYEYDDLGRQVAMIDHPTSINGVEVRHRTESVYNELGQLVISRTNVKQFADGTIDRSESQEQQYVYDARGNVVRTIYADGTEISADYNEQGQKISETNQLGQTRRFEYDIKGRLIAVILPAVEDPESGRMVSPRYEYQYDDFGRQTLVKDPNGFETRFEYDSYGNQVARTLPLGFGEDGIQGTADDPVLPEGAFDKHWTERSIYDDNGRLFMQISFEGVVTTFSYDNRGRVHQKFFWQDLTAYAEGTNPPKETWTYTYDDQGRVTCIDQNGRRTETAYDSLGRTTSIKTPEGTVSYEYDKYGRQARVYSDKGDDVRYSYDLRL